ncbi:MAG: hypothetical protein ACRCZF_04405, partial [Gemmataceae bacterium]
ETEELLDQILFFRQETEPVALDLMEAELQKRGLGEADWLLHDAGHRAMCLQDSAGQVVRCSFCRRPAQVQARQWRKLFGMIPLWPQLLPACAAHQGH